MKELQILIAEKVSSYWNVDGGTVHTQTYCKCTHTRTHTHTHTHADTHAHTHMCACVCTYIHKIHTRTDTNTYTSTYVHVIYTKYMYTHSRLKLACVYSLHLYMKRSYSHRISEWYSLVAAPPLELKPYDCSEKFFFEPKMKSNCTLYSLNMVCIICIRELY